MLIQSNFLKLFFLEHSYNILQHNAWKVNKSNADEMVWTSQDF